MEALTPVQIALLTIYDMCKAVDRVMVIDDVKLLEKSSGKSGGVESRRVDYQSPGLLDRETKFGLLEI